MKTSLISSTKSVTVNGREMIVATLADGATVWIPKVQFDSSAESVTYNPRKAGEKYVTRDGVEGVLKADRNDFVGAGKQVVRKYSALELIEALAAKGITPTFALS
jgi:hypothetical protein